MATSRGGLTATVLLLTAFALASASGATYLQIQGPVSTQLLNNGSIYLGKVGPGESFYVLASATTTNQTGFLINVGWDTLTAVKLPSGWSSQASPLYGNPMKMKVTVSPSAKNGTYQLTLQAINVGNYSRLGNLTVNAYVNVTPNVFTAQVSPKVLVAGVGQPVNINIKMNNTGASDDPFMINAYGLPAWSSPVEVIASHSAANNYAYPVFANEPGTYLFNLTINSTTSRLVQKSYPEELDVRASLINDYGATGQGVVLSPIIYEPAYALMLLLKGAYALVFKQ
jgi:hypothetical protein